MGAGEGRENKGKKRDTSVPITSKKKKKKNEKKISKQKGKLRP